MIRLITNEIVRCEGVHELSDVYNQWGGSFDYIHAAAALVKCGKLPGGGRSSLVDKLCSTWLMQLPQAGLQQCANVLWACVRLGPGAVDRMWDPTWEAYIQLLQKESTAEGGGSPQNVANALWACGKLRKQPSAPELQLMVQTFLRPKVLSEARPQALANVVWALGEMSQLPGWQGGVSEQDIQQLLAMQQLLLVSANGWDTANVVWGLARMAGGQGPIIGVDCARGCSKQLLDIVCDRIPSWEPQSICNVMWACGELGLADTPIMAAAVAAAPCWLPRSTIPGLCQAVTACAALQYRDEAFMQACLQRGLQLLGQQQQSKKQGRSSRPLLAAEGDKLAAICCLSVTRLDIQLLAGPAYELVFRSGIGRQPNTNLGNLKRLWVFHSWLLQHQLLDGQGLTGLLTQQQLQRGAREAAAFSQC